MQYTFKKRYPIVGFILLLGLFITGLSYSFIYKYQATRIEKVFAANANIYATSIEQELASNVNVVISLQALFKAEGIPSREAFKTFTNQLIKNQRAIRAFAWLPRISENERDAYVQNARQHFPTFQILGLKSSGETIPSPPRSVYYPVYYIEPIKGNEKILGLDYFSDEKRRLLFEHARDKGESLFTEPILLENGKGYLIYASIYGPGTSYATLEEKRQNLAGFIVGTFIFQHLFSSFTLDEIKNLDVTLYGLDPIVGERLLYSTRENNKQERNPLGLSYEKNIKVAEETWTLIFTPKAGQYEVKISIQDFIIPGIAMLFFILSSVYVWFILRYSEENTYLASKFTTLLEASTNAKILLDDHNKIVLINQKAEQLLGFSRADLLRQPCINIFTKTACERMLKIKPGKKFKTTILRKDNSEIPVEIEVSPLIESSEEILFVCTFIDLSEITTLEKNLKDATHYDQLTALPNRYYFEKMLRKKLALAKKNNQLLYLFFIGLDQFKTINSSLGLATGDMILKAIGSRMNQLMSGDNFIARTGGDEFILISTALKNKEEAQSIAQRIQRLFSPPLNIAQEEIKMTVSIGISSHPKDGADTESLIKKAALTMHHNKNKGGNTYGFFYAGMDIDYQYKFELETALDFALDRKEFYLEYQPIFEVPSKKIIGMEALLRWKHPKFGLVPPTEFVPLIEHKPLMNDIGSWVFKTAALQSKFWNKKYSETYMSVNLSPYQLQSKNHLHNLIQFCKENEISPKNIVIEITESMIMQGRKKSENLLKALAKNGFSISIDDFGTKYSSLERLTTLPISYLKIDKSFIDGIGKKKSMEQIIKSIIALANNLKLKVIAEGVEAKEQLNFLITHKCFYIQGFYFSQPLSPRKISTLLRRQT